MGENEASWERTKNSERKQNCGEDLWDGMIVREHGRLGKKRVMREMKDWGERRGWLWETTNCGRKQELWERQELWEKQDIPWERENSPAPEVPILLSIPLLQDHSSPSGHALTL